MYVAATSMWKTTRQSWGLASLEWNTYVVFDHGANDPSAGSPTETLLRLLLPLSDKVH